MTSKKINLLKRIIIVPTVLMFFCISQAQTNDTLKNYKEILLGDKWITSCILGLDTSIITYRLTKSNQSPQFGNITWFFGDSLQFISGCHGKCGNDSFTSVRGDYKFIDENKIAISTSQVSYSGYWKKPTEYRKPNYLIFVISTIDKTTIVFTKKK